MRGAVLHGCLCFNVHCMPFILFFINWLWHYSMHLEWVDCKSVCVLGIAVNLNESPKSTRRGTELMALAEQDTLL
jgi:hypothetical protein